MIRKTIVAATLIIAGPTMAQTTSPLDVANARKQVRLAFETEATKAALAKVTKSLDTGKLGRSCDPDDAMLTCEMEDGGRVSVQAVPAKTTKAEAAELCVNPFASEPQKTTVELKGGDKQAGYVLLWCTDKATPSLKTAAQKRIAAAKEEAKQTAEIAKVETSPDMQNAAKKAGWLSAMSLECPQFEVADKALFGKIGGVTLQNPKLTSLMRDSFNTVRESFKTSLGATPQLREASCNMLFDAKWQVRK